VKSWAKTCLFARGVWRLRRNRPVELERRGPQDPAFHEREVWDLPNTPPEKRPLLLHYHPLVIYRFQVLKQADVVLALFLQGDQFTPEEKKADFEYYDPITTGDSTLSGVVQSIIAAEVGYHQLALRYFWDSLFVDIGDLHDNTADGVHVASTGGVWSALVHGFGGMRDHNGQISFDPRLPEHWGSLEFALEWRGRRPGRARPPVRASRNGRSSSRNRSWPRETFSFSCTGTSTMRPESWVAIWARSPFT